MSAAEVQEESMPLESWIHVTEEQILERRQRIGSVATGLRRGVRARILSPGVLIASVGLGMLLERRNRNRQWMLTSVLMAARIGSSLVSSMSSWQTAGSPTAATGDARSSRPGDGQY
jgi:hypothetical protein